MLITTPITSSAATYYFRGQGSGRWAGQGAAGLGLAGPVELRPLTDLLRGCHPADGHFLPARKPARRRAGWDLTVAAPKSVSLLARLADGGGVIATAHRAAVDEVVQHFERRHLVLRRAHAPGGLVAADGLIAAAFDHDGNAAGDPHLHTHLLVCNLARDDAGLWSPIHSGWWTRRAALGAIYQMSLRHHLRQCGLDLPWRVREDGFADVVGVPRAALRAASGRSRAAAAARLAFGSHAAGRTVGIRSAATAQGRLGASPSGSAGFGPAEAARVLTDARGTGAATQGPAGCEEAVAARLAAKRSSFRASDVVVALAACRPEGMAATEAERWVDRFCATARPVPGSPGQAPRWTTDLARAAEERLWARAQDLAARPAPPGVGVAPPAVVAVRELLTGDRSLHILEAPAGRTNLLAQAAVLEAAAAVWRGQGRRVAIETGNDQSAQRWQVLTGLDRYRSGRAADVVVVDQADRRPAAELLAILHQIDRSGAQVVLVEGGTAPRLSWRCSAALAKLGDRLGRVDPGPSPAWGVDAAPAVDSGSGRTAIEAVRALLGTWVEARAGPRPAVLVGLGCAEVDGLNQAARGVLVESGLVAGPLLVSRGRGFQAGDQALALRRLAPTLAPGSPIRVTEVDPLRGVAVVTAPDGATHVLGRPAMAHVGHGYAVTPALALRTSSPLLVLGPADALGPGRGRVAAAALVPAAAARERDHGIRLLSGS